MNDSISSQVLAYLRELGVRATFATSELEARGWQPGAVAGMLNRLQKLKAITLTGHKTRPNGRVDRMFMVNEEINAGIPVKLTSSTRKPVVRKPGLKRSGHNPGTLLLTRQQVRDRLLELAAYFDSNGLADYTEQELVAELGRRYSKEETK